MRLSQFEIKSIKMLAKKYFNVDEVYLFGSRTDDSKKGGDIDLYIDPPEKDESLAEKKIRFLLDLDNLIGEQKIDLVVDWGNDNQFYKICKQGIKF